MADRPEPKFAIGNRVRVPVRLLPDQSRLTMCAGNISDLRWDDEEGWGRKAGWAYGVELDVGGGCRTDEPSIQRLDAVTELGDLTT